MVGAGVTRSIETVLGMPLSSIFTVSGWPVALGTVR